MVTVILNLVSYLFTLPQFQKRDSPEGHDEGKDDRKTVIHCGGDGGVTAAIRHFPIRAIRVPTKRAHCQVL